MLTFLVKNGKMKLCGESLFWEYAKNFKSNLVLVVVLVLESKRSLLCHTLNLASSEFSYAIFSVQNCLSCIPYNFLAWVRCEFISIDRGSWLLGLSFVLYLKTVFLSITFHKLSLSIWISVKIKTLNQYIRMPHTHVNPELSDLSRTTVKLLSTTHQNNDEWNNRKL